MSSDVEDAAKPQEGLSQFGWYLVAVVPVYLVAGAEDADVAVKDFSFVLLGELGGDEGIALDDDIFLEAIRGLLVACSISGTDHLRLLVAFNGDPRVEELAHAVRMFGCDQPLPLNISVESDLLILLAVE